MPPRPLLSAPEQPTLMVLLLILHYKQHCEQTSLLLKITYKINSPKNSEIHHVSMQEKIPSDRPNDFDINLNFKIFRRRNEDN